jgi:hypothetical protein
VQIEAEFGGWHANEPTQNDTKENANAQIPRRLFAKSSPPIFIFLAFTALQ